MDEWPDEQMWVGIWWMVINYCSLLFYYIYIYTLYKNDIALNHMKM